MGTLTHTIGLILITLQNRPSKDIQRCDLEDAGKKAGRTAPCCSVEIKWKVYFIHVPPFFVDKNRVVVKASVSDLPFYWKCTLHNAYEFVLFWANTNEGSISSRVQCKHHSTRGQQDEMKHESLRCNFHLSFPAPTCHVSPHENAQGPVEGIKAPPKRKISYDL